MLLTAAFASICGMVQLIVVKLRDIWRRIVTPRVVVILHQKHLDRAWPMTESVPFDLGPLVRARITEALPQISCIVVVAKNERAAVTVGTAYLGSDRSISEAELIRGEPIILLYSVHEHVRTEILMILADIRTRSDLLVFGHYPS